MKKIIAFISFIVLGTSAFAGNVCKVVEIGGNKFLLCELKPGGPTVPGAPDFGINPPVDKPEKPSYGPTVPGDPSDEAPARPVRPQTLAYLSRYGG